MYNLSWIHAGRGRKFHGFELPIHRYGQAVPALCGRMSYIAMPGVELEHEREQPRAGLVCRDCLKTYRKRRPSSGQITGDTDGA